jgi:hypothetical protein
MRGFEASSLIDASPSAIWSVLTDGRGWTSWDSAVTRLDGSIAPGAKVTVYPRPIPDLGPSFVRFANGLKRQVESSAG